jgi:ribosomal protein S17E
MLLYIYDALNNFLQLELEKGDRLKLSYNHFKTIVSDYLTLKSKSDLNWTIVSDYLTLKSESDLNQTIIYDYLTLKSKSDLNQTIISDS